MVPCRATVARIAEANDQSPVMGIFGFMPVAVQGERKRLWFRPRTSLIVAGHIEGYTLDVFPYETEQLLSGGRPHDLRFTGLQPRKIKYDFKRTPCQTTIVGDALHNHVRPLVFRFPGTANVGHSQQPLAVINGFDGTERHDALAPSITFHSSPGPPLIRRVRLIHAALRTFTGKHKEPGHTVRIR